MSTSAEPSLNPLRIVAVHKLALWRLFLFSFNALCTSIMTALAGTVWGGSDGQTKFLIVISIAANWTNTLMAFFDKSLTRASEGKDPLLPDTTPPLPKP